MECRTCKYWRVDNGIWTMTGWTGDGEHGDCHLERVTVPKRADDFCRDYESKHRKTDTCVHQFEANPGMYDSQLRYCTKCGIVEGAKGPDAPAPEAGKE